ncbi:hypothetical protein LSUE1_G001948 [Lachnellula suecica]|uniref:Uncharacterized protein n=1 Tax=Lachnellula suecica TaxID=602035 RepID=A0A8T9CCI5_9HELO|nr:hypothetical protein LSUE1_G001948 [Lachnellula suecica]
MGRTSKFSFPIPGRKHSSSKKASEKPPRISTQNLSKAQRILGTENDLNIDSPVQDEYQHGFPSPKPSRMSIAISESTNESGSVYGSQSEHWDNESGVFPRHQHQHLRGKASSTILGQRYGDDSATNVSSEILQHEKSSSTLRSHYDRQKSPLSISQQTSESSTRDLALRKGFPPVIQRSPLLQIDSVDPFDKHILKGKVNTEESRYHGAFPRDTGFRKKPAKLDLSMLFPKSMKRGSKSSDADSPSSLSTNTSRATLPDKLVQRSVNKVPSRESLQSKQSARSSRSHDPNKRTSALTSGTLYHLYDHYEQMPVPSPHMDQIPESKVLHRTASKTRDNGKYSKHESSARHSKDRDVSQTPIVREPFSWKNVRSSMLPTHHESLNIMPPRHEASSATSISSRNTKASKASRNTTGSGRPGSAISSIDLKLNSVLSLSSDSEGDNLEDDIKSPTMSSKSKASRSSSKSNSNQRPSIEQSGGLTPRSHSSRNSARKTTGQESHFRSIPEASSTDSQYDRKPTRDNPFRQPDYRKEPKPSTQKEKRPSRNSSVVSPRSLQPTPPLSPSSIEMADGSGKNSRLMAVTEQEEALLAALRQKRARMQEEIIMEHEIRKSPPQIPDKSRSRHPGSPFMGTVHGSERQNVLLYLDTPLAESHQIDMAEPSPDLSDFLSYGSDDDSTPRSSWLPHPERNRARPDSTARPRPLKLSPITPPSAARISAVGSPGFLDTSRLDPAPGPRKRNTGVRFAEEPKFAGRDFDTDTDVIWGM